MPVSKKAFGDYSRFELAHNRLGRSTFERGGADSLIKQAGSMTSDRMVRSQWWKGGLAVEAED